MPGKVACSTCKSWVRDGQTSTGFCHARAPMVNVELSRICCPVTLVADMAHWPRTKETDWCGEHKP